jgi:hypothetical protein
MERQATGCARMASKSNLASDNFGRANLGFLRAFAWLVFTLRFVCLYRTRSRMSPSCLVVNSVREPTASERRSIKKSPELLDKSPGRYSEQVI